MVVVSGFRVGRACVPGFKKKRGVEGSPSTTIIIITPTATASATTVLLLLRPVTIAATAISTLPTYHYLLLSVAVKI